MFCSRLDIVNGLKAAALGLNSLENEICHLAGVYRGVKLERTAVQCSGPPLCKRVYILEDFSH